MNQQLAAFYEILSKVMDPEFNRLVEEVAKPHSSSEEYMRLPDQKDSTLSVADVSVLIAQSSNKYSSSCRLASMARARAKIAEARYKYKFRTSIDTTGSNKESRELSATIAAEEEYDEMIFSQALVELCESFESSNRIASESARRLLLAAEQERRADNREQDHSGSLLNNSNW